MDRSFVSLRMTKKLKKINKNQVKGEGKENQEGIRKGK